MQLDLTPFNATEQIILTSVFNGVPIHDVLRTLNIPLPSCPKFTEALQTITLWNLNEYHKNLKDIKDTKSITTLLDRDAPAEKSKRDFLIEALEEARCLRN